MLYESGNKVFCSFTEEDCEYLTNDSFIRCGEIRVLDCSRGDCSITVVNNGLLLCDCGDSWNCNLCGNDLPYWNRVEQGDTIYFQFQQPDLLNSENPETEMTWGWDSGLVTAQIFDCCSNEPLTEEGITTFADGYFAGKYELFDYLGEASYYPIQQIALNVNDINALFPDFDAENCFYFKFRFYKDYDGAEYDEVCTEPYKFNPCPEKKRSFLLEGEYDLKDCFGFYYGLPVVSVGTEPFNYVNQYRLIGSIEWVGTEYEKEYGFRKNEAVNSEDCDTYSLRANRVPEAVAKIASNIFASKQVFVNGKSYQIASELSKNNEIGNQWFIDIKLKDCNCYNDFSCK